MQTASQTVRAAQLGDHRAFTQLVGQHGDRLFAVAYRILRDADSAHDAIQDSLVLAWRDVATLRDPDRFPQWIQRIVTHVCIQRAVSERRRASLTNLTSWEIGVTREFRAVEDRDEIERGLRRLKPKERALLVMRHYLGYEPAEIASSLGVPQGTVRSRLHHAHAQMHAALDAESRTVEGHQKVA